MSWLLFLDESGHDHRTTPYEVRGGVAIQDSKLWLFVQEWHKLENIVFGGELAQYKTELKGATLVDKDRFKWAAQQEKLGEEDRGKLCRSFLTKGLEKKKPTSDEFAAYGQACVEMARCIFRLLQSHNAYVFASVIPCDVRRPETFEAQEYLRKDHVFLLERFFYFLEQKQEYGLLVMDEVEKNEDRRFVRRLRNYFTKTDTGRYRTSWIVPSPFFVASDMACPVQAADLCIYCINWGFRLPGAGMTAPCRKEISSEFATFLRELQYVGDGYRNGQVFKTYGIVFVPDPYTPR